MTDDARDLVRRWKTQKDDDDDDEEETDSINWDGTPASSISKIKHFKEQSFNFYTVF